MEFWKPYEAAWLKLQGLSGTNCYCDAEAKAHLLSRMGELSLQGIHFLDSGNYHYASRLWLEQAEEPFSLLVFDNHTDMQPPAFGGLLSCGGWIENALRELPNLRRVFLIGPDEEAFSQVEPALRERVLFFSRERLQEGRRAGGGELCRFYEELPAELPLYLSIDKDVLCPEDAATSWSQGELRLSELLEALEKIWKRWEACGSSILGVDICGECEPGQPQAAKNDLANQKLLEFFISYTEKGGAYEE